jgi:hypothetical protein
MILKRQSVVKASLLLAVLTVAGAQTLVAVPLISEHPHEGVRLKLPIDKETRP